MFLGIERMPAGGEDPSTNVTVGSGQRKTAADYAEAISVAAPHSCGESQAFRCPVLCDCQMRAWKLCQCGPAGGALMKRDRRSSVLLAALLWSVPAGRPARRSWTVGTWRGRIMGRGTSALRPGPGLSHAQGNACQGAERLRARSRRQAGLGVGSWRPSPRDRGGAGLASAIRDAEARQAT